MSDISVTIDGEPKKCETLYDAIEHITTHKNFELPNCPKCKACRFWKTWPGRARCRECGHLLDNESFNDLMKFKAY